MQLPQWHNAKFDSSQNNQGLSRMATHTIIPIQHSTLSEADVRSSSDKNYLPIIEPKIHSWKGLSLGPVQFAPSQFNHLKANSHIQVWTATVLCRTVAFVNSPHGSGIKLNFPCKLWRSTDRTFQFTHTVLDWCYTVLRPWQINYKEVRSDTVWDTQFRYVWMN
jgi:hypothetical protein